MAAWNWRGSHKGFIKELTWSPLQQGEDTKDFIGGTVTNQLRVRMHVCTYVRTYVCTLVCQHVSMLIR